jgi:eukaryotic-like serine/threonine-protein kinase
VTPAERQRVRDLFERALDESPPSMSDWVDRHAGDDSTVRGELASLLDHHSRAGAFLEQPVAAASPDLLAGDDALEPGAVVGAYTIERELGAGGMGRVYAARDERLGRLVALKQLGPAVAQSATFRERLRREAQAAAALTHPGICTVYALEEIEGDLFIASELVDGRTLRDEMASGRASVEATLGTARELASALASAHEKGIAHRDLKPENLMRTKDGRLKILDFGLARMDASVHAVGAVSPNLTLPGMLVGTPAYMAPEQVNRQTSDARADVFAFGTVMYEYASGEHPFVASSPIATRARVLESDPAPLGLRAPALPAGFCAVIERCLRKSPDERFQSAGAIAAELEKNDRAKPAGRHATWWRTHQTVLVALYFVASIVAWALKEAFPRDASRWLFIAIGCAAAIAGVVRGHWLFTETMNPPRIVTERRRTARGVTATDLLIAACLAADALLIAEIRPLWTVLTIGLAVGIALAALLMEPATTAAVFGEDG